MLKESAAALPNAQSPIETPIGQPLAQWHLEQARLWHELGSTPLSLIHRQMAQDHADVEYDPYIDTLLLDCQEVGALKISTDRSSPVMPTMIPRSANSSQLISHGWI
jgi:hypothetical protein